MNVAAIQAKATPKQASNPTLTVLVSHDAQTGEIVLRIPQRMGEEMVHASKTDKAVPMISLMPKWADGKPGNVNLPIVIESPNPEDPDNPVETVFGLRLGVFNGFVTAAAN